MGERAVLERKWQASLIQRLKSEFPGSIVLKNDPNYIQGIPDLTIFYKDKWATLECKNSKNAHVQNNQIHYVRLMNQMSYSSFISPDNEEEIIGELQQTFGFNR